MAKVCVMGLGYVGFPTACLVARGGHEVVGVDVNADIVNKLANGGLHIVNEVGLSELATAVLTSGRLRVSTTPEEADVFIIAVPTPLNGHAAGVVPAHLTFPTVELHANLAALRSAVQAIAPYVRPGNLVVTESTVPPGTTEKVVLPILAEHGVDVANILFAHAPERVLPGNLLHELLNNDRMVGGLTPKAGEAVGTFYRSWVQGEVSITNSTTAELVKIMENTYRDVNIALANEMARVCDSLGVNVWEAIKLANRHPRVNFLNPGPGVGGHCIAVDPYFLVEAAPDLTPLVQTARYVNRRMPAWVLALFDELTNGVEINRVAVLGASYKANVGDDRESPALEVARLLIDRGIEVVVHDPYIAKYACPLEVAITGVDAVLILTNHKVYEELTPGYVADYVAKRFLLDTHGIVVTAEWEGRGFRVIQLGTGAFKAQQEAAIH